MNTAEAKDLCNKIPKFSGQKEEIQLYSKIDLTSGFWQMFLNPECRKYTAFTLPGIGQFDWNASPAGLVGATGSFQRLMEIVIHQLKNVLAHIDDLLVHPRITNSS
jgi:hypothetical protein